MKNGKRRHPAATRRVCMLAYDGANSLDVVGPLEVFSTATRYLELEDPAAPAPYAIEILAAKRGLVRTFAGIALLAERPYADVRAGIDTLLVAGGDTRGLLDDAVLLRWLRRMQPRVRRLGSVCTGAFILAAAGLLAGKRATTHWRWADALAAGFPEVQVEADALYVRDGNVYTSAGVTSGMDLALALVEEDLGQRLALEVARGLVLFLKRPGGQSQFSSHLAAQAVPRGPLKDLPEWIVDHLDEDLTIECLAERVAMSPRNFARVFLREMGVTPAKFVERARVERARRSLEETRRSMDEVAGECGFGSAERMRRTFRRHLRVVPHDYRKRFERVRTVAG
jgi:transcriptional regulator GlxA family with amidase domain